MGEGRTDWAVHVALAFGGIPKVATVAPPGQGQLLSTAEPPPAPAARPGPIRLLVARTRPPRIAEYLAQVLGADLVPLGSAGAKAMAVVQGAADVYAHSGGQYEWDSAAPVGVATAAGCHCSRLDGAPLVYNRPDPYLPDLLVCRADLAATVLDAVRGAAGSLLSPPGTVATLPGFHGVWRSLVSAAAFGTLRPRVRIPAPRLVEA